MLRQPERVVVGLLFACGAAAAAPAGLPDVADWQPPPPKPEIVQGWSGAQDLVFLDGGAVLLATSPSNLAVIDPRRRTLVAAVGLDSPRVPDRGGITMQGATREQAVYAARWGWDAARRSLVGAVCVGGSGDVERRLSVWSPGQPAPPRALPVPPKEACRPLAISADTTVVLAGAAAKTAQLFTVATARPLGPPIALASEPRLGAFSPTGTQVALAGDGGDLALYDLAAHRVAPITAGHNQRIRALVFAPARPVLVAVGDVEVVAVDLGTHAVTHVADSGDGISAAAFSPDGAWLAVGAAAQKTAILDATTFQPARSLDTGAATALAFSPDSSLLAVQSAALEIHALGPVAAAPAIDRAWFDQLVPLPLPGPALEPAFGRAGVVDGRVTSGGKPVAGAEVRLTPRLEEWPRARTMTALVQRTGADGRYRFAGVPEIDWNLQITAPGLTRGGFLALLRGAHEVSGAQSTLDPAVTIRGVVLGADGKPAAGAQLANGDAYSYARVELGAGRDGTFTIDHLRRVVISYGNGDAYVIHAWLPDGSAGVATAMVKETSPVQVTVKLLAPDDPSVARLQILDDAGAPMPDADVRVGSFGAQHHADAKGRFSTVVDPQRLQDGGFDVEVVIAGRDFRQHVAWPAHGIIPVTVHRAVPPGTLLPLSCTLYREATERVQRCARIPQVTRDALVAELARDAATWATAPDQAEFACSQGEQRATHALLCKP